MARIEKLSAKEIGKEMNRSENAVHLLLGRALKSLAPAGAWLASGKTSPTVGSITLPSDNYRSR